MDGDVPLVIPEINPGAVYCHGRIIACPSAATIQLLLVLHPIHVKAVVKRAVVSCLEAVSDAGQDGMDELTSQIKDLFCFRDAEVSSFPHQTAFNVVPQTSAFLAGGHTADELSILAGATRIIGNAGIRVCATTVQVPVFYSHSQSVVLETESRITPEEVRDLLERPCR
jgi:aspartate-semialdehyde dehydrogenase